MILDRTTRGAAIGKIFIGLIALAVLSAGYFYLIRSPGGDARLAGTGSTAKVRWVVQRSDLTISALASGELRTKNNTAIRNEARRSLKITWVIPEGTRVEPGEKLIELDASEVEERYLSQRISVSTAAQSVQQARDDIAIAESRLGTNLISAQNNVRIAQLGLEKYKSADFKQQERDAESANILAAADLSQAESDLEWTEKLHDRDFVTTKDLDEDRLKVKRYEIQEQKTNEDRDILTKYDYEIDLTQFQTQLVEAEGFMKEIELTGERDLNSRAATLDAAQEKSELEKIQLKNLEEQLEGTVIYAPKGGLVVYSKSRSRYGSEDAVLDVGTTVSPRQTLIDLPDFSSWVTEARVHESMIQQIRDGQVAFITLDAFQDNVLAGKVTKIAILPDSSNFMRDTQEYVVEIDMEQNLTTFKPGMSGRVEIIVEELKDVVAVPMQAVSLRDGKPVVMIAGETGPAMQIVEVGLNNGRMVQILSGLEPGQEVLMDQAVGAGSGLGPRPSEMASEEQREDAGEASRQARTASPAAESLEGEGRRRRGQRGEGEGRGEWGEREGGQGRRGGPPAGFDPGQMSTEQREQMMQRMQDRMKDMSPARRKQMEDRMKEFQGGGTPSTGETPSPGGTP